MTEKPEHHLTRAKRLREEAALAAQEGTAASIEAPVVPVTKTEYRVMNKRGDIADYASSKVEAEEKVLNYEGGYIVKV